MNYLVTGGLMGWLIGERLPGNIFNIGDFHKYVRPINAEGFAGWIDHLLGLYDPAINFAQMNLLDSHDTPRFLTTAGGDLSALKLGWLFLFTYLGAPCIYYGDEIGLSGGPDPACRGAFPWNKKAWNKELHAYAKSLTALRHAHPALRRGTYQRLYAKDNVFAFARRMADETVIIAINAGTDTALAEFPLAGLQLDDGPCQVFFGEANPSISAGQVQGLKLAPRSGVVFGK
jgi:neopullulanase